MQLQFEVGADFQLRQLVYLLPPYARLDSRDITEMEAHRQKQLFGGSVLPSGGLHPGPSSGPKLDASHKLAKNGQASSSSSSSGSRQGSSFAKNRAVANLEVVEDVSDDSMNITAPISVSNGGSKSASTSSMFIPKNIQRRGVNNRSAPLGMRRETTTPVMSPAPFKSHAAKLDVQQDKPATSSKGKGKSTTTTNSATTSTTLRSGTSKPSTISYESLEDISRPPKSASFLDTSSSPKLKIAQTARDAIAAALCKGEGTSKTKQTFAVEIPSRPGVEKHAKGDRQGNELASTSAASRKAQPFPMSDEDGANPATLQSRTSPRHSTRKPKESNDVAQHTKTLITPMTSPPPAKPRKTRHLPVDRDSDSDFARRSPQPSPPRTRSQIDRKRKRGDATVSTKPPDPVPVGSTSTKSATESGAKKPSKPRPKPIFKVDAETQQRAQGGLLRTVDQHIPSDTDEVAPSKASSRRAKPFPLSPGSKTPKLKFREINTDNDLPSSSPPTPSSVGRCSSPPSSQSQQSPPSPTGKGKRVLKKLKALQPFPLDSPGGGPSAPGSKTRGTHETPNALHPFPMNSPDDGVTPRVRRSSSRLRGTKRVFSISDEDSESATSASRSEYGSPAKRMKITKSHHGEGASSSA